MTDQATEYEVIKTTLADKGLDGKDKDKKDEKDIEEVEDQSEEIIVEDTEDSEEVELEEEQAESEQDEEEIQASQDGWQPKKEWIEAGNDPDEWVTAKQFIRNGEYLRKIHNQNRKIKQLDGVVITLAKQQKKIFDAGYDKAKRELKSRLREATKEGDDALADQIEERLEGLETQRQEDLKTLDVGAEETQQQDQTKIAPEFASWVDRNQWFVKYPEMRAYAEVEGVKYAQKNPEMTNVEVYKFVTDTVKKRFPERFGMATKKQASKKSGSPVESSDNLTSGRQRGEGGVVKSVSLTAEEKTVGRTLISRGLYKNLNEYAKDLKQLGVKG